MCYMYSVRGVRVDQHAVVEVEPANGLQSIGVGRTAADEAVTVGEALEFRGLGQIEVTLLGQLAAEQIGHPGSIAAEQIEDEPLEIGCLADVHGGAGRGCDLAGRTHPVAAGGEELVQHVVLVGGQDERVDRQSHLAGDVARADVAEVAGGHREADPLIVLRRHPQPQCYVVDHLRRQPRPVDRVDRTDVILRLEFGVGVDGLDGVLAVVEDTVERDVVNVGILQPEHLCLLEGTHATCRSEHVDTQPISATHRVLGGRAGVSAGRAHNGEMLIASVQFVGEQFSEQLHRHVLEGRGRTVGQMPEPQRSVPDPLDRHDAGRSELLRGVRAPADAQQVIAGNVVHEKTQHTMREYRVPLGGEHIAPTGQCRRVQLRVFGGYVQATIAGKTFEQDVAEAGRLRASRTASRDVSHKPSLSVLASRPMPMKHRGLRVDEAVSVDRVRRTVRRAGPVARG
ncbi:hypothetical protein SDC9_103883 [bioreactor metagenome]|uniref:Uncharacterized protein n=1 Tax=bioreactor metagenome TaxID=1076179 RepID=A0A645AUY3_9ZZZZ